MRWIVAVVLCFVASSFWGCAEPVQKSPPPHGNIHIRGVWHVAAIAFRPANGDRWPQDLAELKSWCLAHREDDIMKKMHISEYIDELFESPRDKLPYVILKCEGNYPPTVQNPPWEGGAQIFAHEAKGLNGKRWVMFAGGAQAVEMSDEEFKKALAAMGKK